MKHFKVLGFALLLIVGPVLIESCCWNCDSKCYIRKHKPTKFNIDDIGMKVGIRYTSPFQLAPHSNMASKLDFLFELKASSAQVEPSEPHFRPTMAAFAQTECNPNRVESEETLKSYSVVSNNVLVSDKGTFQAGQNLSDIFYLTDGGPDTPFHAHEFTLYPIFVAKEKADHIFTFTLTLSDGRKFEIESGVIELLPE